MKMASLGGSGAGGVSTSIVRHLIKDSAGDDSLYIFRDNFLCGAE